MFYKNDCVKQKKYVLSIKQTESYGRADVIALRKMPKDESKTFLKFKDESETFLIIQE